MPSSSAAPRDTAPSPRLSPWWALAVFAGLLALVFHNSFVPELTLFSNDGPLGAISANSGKLPEGFFGVWNDLNWIGTRGIGASPNVSSVWAWLAKPVLFSKTYPPLALFLVGLTAWFMFRQMGFRPAVCVLGGFAALLNSNVLSIACWGLPAWSLARAMVLLALGILASQRIRSLWVRAALAGLAVGMGVMEGFDVGAIYSLYVAAWVVFLAWTEPGRPTGQRVMRGVLSVSVVACFAVFIAAQSLSALVSTQVQGVAGTGQDTRTKEERWDWATQWSLPKLETLRVVIPGLFGYRMDTPDGGAYWGRVGRQPGWEEHHQGLPRHSGSGEYAGVLVVLLAAWAFGQSLRGEKSPYSLRQRQFIWFWSAAGFISLLFAFGRHAPFYQFVYYLPYFSTIRNPIKFMNPLHVGLLVLFGYGLQDLFNRYLCKPSASRTGLQSHFAQWWRNPANPDKRWATGLIVLLVLALGTLGLYAFARGDLERYLTSAAFDAERAKEIAAFSIREMLWFVVFLGLSTGLLLVIWSGYLSGPRARFATVALGFILLADLVRADQPWIIYYNYKVRYASNPVLDILRETPYESRTASRLAPMSPNYLVTGEVHDLFAGVTEDWLQQQYQFYNIQSLDIVQMPRMPEMDAAYLGAVFSSIASSELLNIGSLAAKLTNHSDAVSQYLWSKFPAPAQSALVQSGGAESARPLLRRELNRVLLSDSGLYDPTRFTQVQLSEEARAHLDPRLLGRDPGRFNRLLLQDAYPAEIAKKAPFRAYARLWQLTNTRRILGMGGFLDIMNQQMDPLHRSFRVRSTFDFAPSAASGGIVRSAADITAVLRPQGQFAVFDYGAALPRAKFYSSWQVLTNDDWGTLEQVADFDFDVQNHVLVSDPLTQPPQASTPGATGSVQIVSYEPKHLALKVSATAPGVVLLNEKIDPNWKVTVDGKPESLLRCNYIMQGVYVAPGEHQIEFRFDPPHWTLFVSVAAILVGMGLCGLVVLGGKRGPVTPEELEPASLATRSVQPANSAAKSKPAANKSRSP